MRRNRLLLVSIGIIIVGTLAPSSGNHNFVYLDKIVHFVLFLFLSLNICFKYQDDNPRLEFLMWAIFFGLITEVLQQFVPGRDMNIYDGLADTLGVIVGYYWYRKSKIKIDEIALKIGA